MNNYNYDYYRAKNEINMPKASIDNKYVITKDPYQGFIKGNMFDNLYKPYKNYKIMEFNPTDNRQYQLLLVQMYAFAAHDLSLYLDINPDDVNAIDLRMRYMDAYQEALTNYETSFGPVTESSQLLSSIPWAWTTKRWPWEGYNV